MAFGNPKFNQPTNQRDTIAELCRIRGVLNELIRIVNGTTPGGVSPGLATLAEQQAQTALLAKSNLQRLKTEANDLVETYTYLDPANPTDRRINTIVYSSIALGLNVTETFTYGGVVGDYYVTSSTLS